jgi:predicted transcriptional regulator
LEILGLMVWNANELAKQFRALGHPVRLHALKALTTKDMYLSEIAGKLGVSRALAKIHLTKLVKAGLVETRAVLMDDEARARRYYTVTPFDIHISPKRLAQEVEGIEL